MAKGSTVVMKYYCFGTLESKEIHVMGPDIDYYIPQHVVRDIIECGCKGHIKELVEALKLAGAPKKKIMVVGIIWWCFQEN